MDLIAVDTETTGLHVYNGDKPFAISGACYNDGEEIEIFYTDFPVNPFTRHIDVDYKSNEYLWWQNILTDDKITKVFHNAKFDIKMLASIHLPVHGIVQDTMLAARCCNTLESNYKLKYLAERYVGIGVEDEKDLKDAVRSCRFKGRSVKYKKHVLDGNHIETDYWLPKFFHPTNTLCEQYAVLDAVRTLKLWDFYEQGIEKFDATTPYNKEMKLLKILIKMENRGIKLDLYRCKELIIKYEKEIDRESKKVYRLLGKEINLNSPKQLLKIVGPKYQIKATGVEYLEDFREHDEIEGILNIRGIKKGCGYFKEYLSKCTDDGEKTLADLANWKTKVIHGNFNQGNTRTWRLSCNNPNLQNVSNPKTAGNVVVNVRNVFGPREDYIWYCIDYSGLEMRIFADLIKDNDPTMYEAFAAGRDPHDEVRKAVPELAKLEPGVGRKYAKNVGFCKIFGGGPKALVKYIKPSGTERQKVNYCRKILNQYDKSYPGIVGSINQLAKQGAKDRHVKNFFGRSINIDPNFAYRACNYMVQSSAADLIKSSMIKIDEYLSAATLTDAHIVLSIHDEIVVEVHKEHAYKSLIRNMAHIMADNDGAFDIATPVEVEKTATYWGEKSKKGMEWLNV